MSAAQTPGAVGMCGITFVGADGTRHAVQAPAGWTLMEAAVKNDIDGIVAECGGSCACATCHVRLDEATLGRLAPAEAMELDMLECTAEPAGPASRLACQVVLGPALDGCVVQVPERQVG